MFFMLLGGWRREVSPVWASYFEMHPPEGDLVPIVSTGLICVCVFHFLCCFLVNITVHGSACLCVFVSSCMSPYSYFHPLSRPLSCKVQILSNFFFALMTSVLQMQKMLYQSEDRKRRKVEFLSGVYPLAERMRPLVRAFLCCAFICILSLNVS